MFGFFKNTSGNVAMTFALCLLPMMVMVGFFIDFGRQESQEQATIAALDYATLATAKRLQDDPTISEPELQTYAQDFFDSGIGTTELTTYQPISLTREGDEILVSVEGKIDTTIMGLIGVKDMDLRVSNGAGIGGRRPLELIMVADVSLSMDGPGITILRTAANAMLDELYSEPDADVRIGIVPFSSYVNIGIDTRGPWLEVLDDKTDIQNRCVTDQSASEALGCTFQRTCEQSGLIGGGEENCRTQVQCPAGVDVVTVCQDVTITSRHSGCVRSRHPYPANIEDGDYSAIPIVGEILTAGATAFICKEENIILPLTDDVSIVRNKLAELTPTGNTYVPSGLMWGLRALSDIEPLAEAKLTPDNQAIILISDGANTRSISDTGRHFGTNMDAADDLTLEVCDSIKNKGIRLFTIDFGILDVETEQLLRDCATSVLDNFEADTATQLRDSLLQITGRFDQVTLSR